jgi:Prealbumin-like fold domain
VKVVRKFRPRHAGILALAIAAATALTVVLTASSASLPGSNFEIDTNANLKLDGSSPAIDWATVSENRQQDLPTGQNDDSYKGGSKEDDPCPPVETGSIPNNKSDLRYFGAYNEPGDPGFLNVFWNRVNAPTGTTLMDFEFNHLTTPCGNGVNVVRSEGDILLEYSIEQGGATAHLTKREWTGSAWSDAVDLTNTGAIGTINSTSIPAAESDGLISGNNSLTPRTFGEASFDLADVFDPDKCESFGSAMLKSRSSDAFTSALKDFIKPISVNIHNCGQVIVRKETDPASTVKFDFTKSFNTDPSSDNAFQLADGEHKTFDGVLEGTGYNVTEGDLPAGWEFDDLDCDDSVGVTPTIVGKVATFDINDSADVVDCTYTNVQHLGAIKISKLSAKAAATGLADAEFSVTGPNSYSSTPKSGADGTVCIDGLAFGDYTVTETKAPTGYSIDDATGHTVPVDNNAKCSDDPFVGETINFTDTPLTDIVAKAKSQATGGTASTVTCVDENGDDIGNSPVGDPTPVDPAEVDANGLEPGTYTCTIVIDP